MNGAECSNCGCQEETHPMDVCKKFIQPKGPLTRWEDPAFPVDLRDAKDLDHVMHLLPGLTKRQWYAGLAMQGLLVNSTWVASQRAEQVAKEAIASADALLKALEEKA